MHQVRARTATDSADILIGRRNTEGGGRQDDVGHQSYRIVVGVRGELSDIWSYDAFLQTGETKRNETYFNDFSMRRTGNALNVAELADGSVFAPSTAMPIRRTMIRTAFHGISGKLAV